MDNVYTSPSFQNNSFASVAQRCRERIEAEAEKEKDDVSGFSEHKIRPLNRKRRRLASNQRKCSLRLQRDSFSRLF